MISVNRNSSPPATPQQPAESVKDDSSTKTQPSPEMSEEMKRQIEEIGAHINQKVKEAYDRNYLPPNKPPLYLPKDPKDILHSAK